jgi:hypothetical protein
MIPDQLSHWRQAIEVIDLTAAGSRQQLNQLYTEIVTQLRQEFHSAIFTIPAPSLDQKRAAEAADPGTDTERLWELSSHHPGEVANNSVWSLLLLEGSGLIGKKEYIDDEKLFPFAQVEGFWQQVYRSRKEDYYEKLSLSYTALLPLEKHPFPKEPLIQALYGAGDALSANELKSLGFMTDGLEPYGKSMLQPIQEVLNSLEDPEFPLPGNLQLPNINDLLLALAPVFSEGDELFELVFNRRHWGHEGVFLDASPLAEKLLSFSKTKLVERGVRVDTETLMPAEVYERLARHRNSGPKSEVAGCIHAPVEVLEELANSSSKEIIYPLACNPMTPVPVLCELMDWGGWGAKTVKGYVQKNPAYGGGEIWQLMEMGQLQLKTDQRKKDVLLACLDLLASETDPLEALRLLINASIWASWRLEPSTLRLQMIQKGWASEELMLAASWSWHWLERLAVASSPLAPAKALAKLQGDGLRFIRHAALQPRRSVEEAAAAASPSGWMGKLATLAAADPVACVRDPRFSDWLNREPDRVASLLSKQHRTILAAADLPVEYFCWRMSQLGERDQLRLLMHRELPQQALNQLVRYDAEHDKLISWLPEKKQGALADLVASTAASHHQQTNPELLRCALKELGRGDQEELTPHEIAFFVMGFYNPADVSLVHIHDLLKLVLHPCASHELRNNIGQQLDKCRHGWDALGVNRSGYFLRTAIHAYAFTQDQEYELKQLRIAGRLLGLQEISEGLRDWFIALIAELANQILIDGQRNEFLKTPVEPWPALLSEKVTKKLISSSDISKRLVAVCFGNLNDAEMEILSSDSQEEIRFALALLRACPRPVLEKLSADKNVLVNKAAIQNRNCTVITPKGTQGRSPLRNPNLPEETARDLLKGQAFKTYLKHAAEILCWTPTLMQMILDTMESDQLSSFIWELEYGSRHSPFSKRPYSPELLSWMAQLPVDSKSDLNTLRQLAAAHPATPVPVLEELAKDSPCDVRESVASNPACPTELHQRLREQGISGNAYAVVSSPNYPVEWLAAHAGEPDPDLRATVSLHPHCPLSLLIQLLADTAKTSDYGPFNNRTVAEVAATSPALTAVKDPASFEEAALVLLRSTRPSSRARRLALRSPQCPPLLLRRCATSLDWRERHAVACHPNTPTPQLKALEQDANQHVAQASMKRCSGDVSLPSTP